MPPKSRLDPVVRLQEHRENRSLADLADANQKSSKADAALKEARLRTASDSRVPGNAADWLLAETAHARALGEAASAQRNAHQASEIAGGARVQYLAVHARTEALRRVAEARRSEIVIESSRTERKLAEDLYVTRLGYTRAA